MIMKRRSTIKTGKVDPANVDAFDALARNDQCHQSTAIVPKGRQSSPSYCTLYTLNPLMIRREGLSPRASNKSPKNPLNAVA